jgi:hypothetical protein
LWTKLNGTPRKEGEGGTAEADETGDRETQVQNRDETFLGRLALST